MTNLQLMTSLGSILGMNFILFSILIWSNNKFIDQKISEMQKQVREYKDMLKELVKDKML